MLTEETIKVVKSTIPLLEKHGLDITRHFYGRLFTNHPELQHIFNQANQQEETQARALADAVFGYANHIDNLEALLPAVQRIAHKHASLGVTPGQYEVVGENLLAAIREVLDLPENHAALSAWGDAYQVLADVFINAEETIYKQNEKAEGGWRGFREFVIADIVTETPEVKSFYLKPSDGSAIAPFKGGQYVGVKLDPEEFQFSEIRQYSLSGKSGADHYRISTKVEPHGQVTNYMHNNPVGTTVLLQPPTGVFTLNPKARRQVFVAGGIGITPLISMLYEVLQSTADQEILFIQCARSAGHLVFGDELRALAKQYGFTYKQSLDEGDSGDHEGLINAAVLEAWGVGADADVYFCGPKPFMSALNKLLRGLGLADENLHYEVFGPTTTF